MRKVLYYLSPFFLTPIVMLSGILIAEIPGIKAYMFYIMGFMLCVYAAVLARFSTSPRTYDVLLAALMLLSGLFTMFTAGFFDQTETVSRFDLRHAVRVALQLPGWILYFLMSISAFAASRKKWRIQKRR